MYTRKITNLCYLVMSAPHSVIILDDKMSLFILSTELYST